MNHDLSSVTPQPSSTPNCGVCGAPAATIKSHIIPRCVQNRLRGDDQKFTCINLASRQSVAEHANRFWQAGLLCEACERQSADLDAFWARFADQRGPTLSRIQRRGIWTLPHVDCPRLTMFLLSVLIRAHTATHADFAEFTLGESAEHVRAALRDKDPLASGFKLAAQLPKLNGVSSPWMALPFLTSRRRSAILWFGVFRFEVEFPSPAEPEAIQHRRFSHARGGLTVSTVDLESLPEFILSLRFVAIHEDRKRHRGSRHHRAPKPDIMPSSGTPLAPHPYDYVRDARRA